MIPDLIREAIQPITGSVHHAGPVGGGCIAHATRVEAQQGLFFLKWAEGEAGQTFRAEADGLKALRKVATGLDLVVPEPLVVQKSNTTSGFLLMEWIEAGQPTTDDWWNFGRVLAELHRVDVAEGEGGSYGYISDNWIGSKPQKNGWMESWPEFFGEKRLRAQAELVREWGFWNAAWDAPLDRLISRLNEILTAFPHPSLLHGDLWAGNALATSDGRFALIDPAVYIGHREADLAMTELFGGFAPAFYEGYREAWPVESGYAERRDVYNLFHLINHLTHGPGYAGQVERVLNRFGI